MSEETTEWRKQYERIAELEARLERLIHMEDHAVQAFNQQKVVIEELEAELAELNSPVQLSEWQKMEQQLAELDDYLHEIYHIDKRGTDENYDDWHAMCDVGEVISRYLKSRQEVKGDESIDALAAELE